MAAKNYYTIIEYQWTVKVENIKEQTNQMVCQLFHILKTSKTRATNEKTNAAKIELYPITLSNVPRAMKVSNRSESINLAFVQRKIER